MQVEFVFVESIHVFLNAPLVWVELSHSHSGPLRNELFWENFNCQHLHEVGVWST
jgi:hypothetical protein